jgi:hypothetical protein
MAAAPLPVEYAVDEQMRVEALRIAVSFCVCFEDYDENDVMVVAERFFAFLTMTVPPEADAPRVQAN